MKETRTLYVMWDTDKKNYVPTQKVPTSKLELELCLGKGAWEIDADLADAPVLLQFNPDFPVVCVNNAAWNYRERGTVIVDTGTFEVADFTPQEVEIYLESCIMMGLLPQEYNYE